MGIKKEREEMKMTNYYNGYLDIKRLARQPDKKSRILAIICMLLFLLLGVQIFSKFEYFYFLKIKINISFLLILLMFLLSLSDLILEKIGIFKTKYDYANESVLKLSQRYGIKEPENFIKFIETLKTSYNMSSDDINNYLNEKHSSNLKNINEYFEENSNIFM